MMLSAGVHTGTRNSDSGMEEYIWRRRKDGLHVLNISKTWEKIMLAARVIVAIENPDLELPMYITSEVTYTEPGIKGDTATNTMKPATISTGAEVRVPLFIDTGETIKVDTRTGVYVERVKN